MTEKTMTVEKVMESRDKTLKENYEPHDVLQEYVEVQLQALGFEIKQHGTDNRDHDGDHITYGHGPDLAVYDDGELQCYIEVKSKRDSSAEWFGRLNRRHFEEYLYGESDLGNADHQNEFDGAENIDEDVYLYFGVVDEDRQLVIRDGFLPVDSEDQIGDGFRCYGNIVVELDTDDVRNLNWLLHELRD